MSNAAWNVDTKADAIKALQSAYDDLVDALDCATEMDDAEVEHHVSRAQGSVDDLIAYLELRR